MAEPKVVGIHGGKTISGEGATPLPKTLIKVRDGFRLKLQGFLRQLFDGADDALFEMIDKAGSSADQEFYFDAMRELRLQKRNIATNVVKELLVGFNTINQNTNDQQKSKEDHIEALDLVDQEQLEVNVAVEAMVNRVNIESGTALIELCKRVSSLLSDIDVEIKDFPASPFAVCNAFVEACECLDFGIRARLIVLKLFERYVLSQLPQVYVSYNQQLRKAGLLPNLASENANKKRAARPASTQTVEVGATAPTNTVPVLNEDQYLSQGIPFSELRSLLHGRDIAAQAPVALEGDIPKSNVIQILSLNQNSIPSSPFNGNDYERLDFKSMIADAENDSDGRSVSGIDSDTISLISMLFDFILDDRQLQPVMKALIARLQIPILKVAMLDRSFFDRGGHPARKLLNEIASAALGWSESKSDKTDRLKNKIETVVNKILKEFDQDISMFQAILDDFTKFVVIENRRGKLLEQRTRDAEHGKAAIDIAKKEVSDAITAILSDVRSRGHTVPQSVDAFLSKAWSSVLNYTYLNGGPVSDSWNRQIRLVKDLLWTVCPDKGELDTRGKLLKTIPGVMRECRAGLKSIMFDEFETKSLLGAIEASHIDVMNNLQTYEEFQKSSSEQEVASELIRDTIEIEKEFDEFKSNIDALPHENTLQNPDEGLSERRGEDTRPAPVEEYVHDHLSQADTAEEASSELNGFLNQVDHLSIGTWFEITKEETRDRCKLAAHIKAIDKYIFVNRSGIKVMERDKNEFAKLLSSGDLQILNDGLLFDRALESVIGSLRGSS